MERGAVADAEEGAAAGAAVKADDPSLADMTRAALSILLKNEKGFFLLIEGKSIGTYHIKRLEDFFRHFINKCRGSQFNTGIGFCVLADIGSFLVTLL